MWTGLKGNSKFYNYSLSINGEEEKHGDDYESDYLTDVMGRKAADFLDNLDGKSGIKFKKPISKLHFSTLIYSINTIPDGAWYSSST